MNKVLSIYQKALTSKDIKGELQGQGIDVRSQRLPLFRSQWTFWEKTKEQKGTESK